MCIVKSSTKDGGAFNYVTGNRFVFFQAYFAKSCVRLWIGTILFYLGVFWKPVILALQSLLGGSGV
jgi:hypothetical protein